MNVDPRFFQLLHEKRSVTDVCIRAQGISHFYYVYFFAKITQNGSKFAAYQTASENDYLLTNLLCLEVVILGYYHFTAFSKTRDRRHSRGPPPTTRTFLINSERIYEEKIFSRPLSAVFYPGHRLYNRESVEMRELEGEKLITLNERFYSYHAIVKRCSETGFTPDIRIKTMEGQLIYKFTAERQGTGIDVDFHRSTPWSQDLRTVEIEDSIPWTVFAVCPVDKKDDPRIKELLDYYRGICLR